MAGGKDLESSFNGYLDVLNRYIVTSKEVVE